jgi:hypothetical protein
MTHKQAIRKRDALIEKLSDASQIVRGALLQRTTRHSSGCAKCARGEGHPQSVLTISYPGGATRQISLRAEQVPQVRQWLDNYHQLKDSLESICELNLHLLRPDGTVRKAVRKK